jgi:hypothetical protein
MTLYAMRASRKQRHTVGRGAAEDADRGAMAGGGASRGRGGTAKPPPETKQDLETTGSRKRKRGQTNSDMEDGVEESNGTDDSLSHQTFPELGMNFFVFDFWLIRSRFE